MTSQTFRRTLTSSLVAASLLFATNSAFAGGYQLNNQSAKGLGRAFAGDAVIADDASVMSRNAAAMTMFDTDAISFGMSVVDTDIQVKSGTYHPIVGADQDTSFDQAGDTSYVPNMYYIHPVNDKWAIGFMGYTNFGTKTEFDDSMVGVEYGGLTDVKSFNLGFAAAYRVDEHWSFGAGIDAIYGEGRLKRSYTAPKLKPWGDDPSAQEVLDIDANGWAFGANVGVVYEVNDNHRFGFSYHYSPRLDAKGDVTIAGETHKDTLKLPLPDMIEFSGYHRLNNAFAVHYSIQHVTWDEFDTLDLEKTGAIKNYQWEDTFHYAIGGTWYVSPEWTLRAGYMYDESAQGDYGSVSVPDSARNWFSTGATYAWNQNSAIDFGFTYLMGEDNDVHEAYTFPAESDNELTSIDAVTRADALIFGLQYSHSF